VRLLAATASHTEQPFCAATVGRATGKGVVTVARIEPIASDARRRRQLALDHLAVLVDLYDRGMREPLPVYCLSSHAYAEAAAQGRDAAAAAQRAWASEWILSKEDVELEHQLVLDGVRTFDEVLAEPPRSDEQGQGWDMSDSTRFGRYARRIWDAPLRYEEVVTE
jgi:exodeoxyribonuclease V gamma subunit